jgi:hypothetical protein
VRSDAFPLFSVSRVQVFPERKLGNPKAGQARRGRERQSLGLIWSFQEGKGSDGMLCHVRFSLTSPTTIIARNGTAD